MKALGTCPPIRPKRITCLVDELNKQSNESGVAPIQVLDLANGPIQSFKDILVGKLVSDDIAERIHYNGYDTDGVTQDQNRIWVDEVQTRGTYTFHAAEAVETPFQGPNHDQQYNIAYGTGFFDYLPDDFLVKYWKQIYAALAPGGSLIISLKDSDRYHAQSYQYLVRWDQFYQRNQAHFEGLLDQAFGGKDPERCVRDETGIILFYVVRKD